MRIVNWNCNGAFRKKFHLFENMNLDVLIIQECEDPEQSTKEYKEWANNYLWLGNNKNKGIGIFIKSNVSINKLNWSDINTNYKNEQLESFLPCLINDVIFICVWTKKANSDVFGYIGQLWKYLQLHKEKMINKKVVIVGDFNSNTIWDKWDRWWNHTDVVNELEEINIISLYHFIYKEKQGMESQPTFFLQRNKNKSYHIDYVFASKNIIDDSVTYIINNNDKWLIHSDHLPIEFNIN